MPLEHASLCLSRSSFFILALPLCVSSYVVPLSCFSFPNYFSFHLIRDSSFSFPVFFQSFKIFFFPLALAGRPEAESYYFQSDFVEQSECK